jgi:hypothetical protein
MPCVRGGIRPCLHRSIHPSLPPINRSIDQPVNRLPTPHTQLPISQSQSMQQSSRHHPQSTYASGRRRPGQPATGRAGPTSSSLVSCWEKETRCAPVRCCCWVVVLVHGRDERRGSRESHPHMRRGGGKASRSFSSWGSASTIDPKGPDQPNPRSQPPRPTIDLGTKGPIGRPGSTRGRLDQAQHARISIGSERCMSVRGALLECLLCVGGWASGSLKGRPDAPAECANEPNTCV